MEFPHAQASPNVSPLNHWTPRSLPGQRSPSLAERPGPEVPGNRVVPCRSEPLNPTAPSCSPTHPRWKSLPAPGRQAQSTHLAPQKRPGRAAGRCGLGARCGEADGSSPVHTSCGIRDPYLPRRRPPARGAAVAAAAAAEKLNGAGTGAAPPLPPPPGVRSAALAPAQKRRARAATCTARQVHGAPGRPPALVSTPRPPPVPGTPRARRERVRGGSRAARSARGCGDGETPLERSSARFLEATPRPGPAARRGAKSRDCRRRHRRRRQARRERRPLSCEPAGTPRLSRSRERGCHRHPPPPTSPSLRPPRPGPGADSAKSGPAATRRFARNRWLVPASLRRSRPGMTKVRDQWPLPACPPSPPAAPRAHSGPGPVDSGELAPHSDPWLPGTTSDLVPLAMSRAWVTELRSCPNPGVPRSEIWGGGVRDLEWGEFPLGGGEK